MDILKGFLEIQIFGNSLEKYLVSFSIFLAIMIFFWLLKVFVINKLEILAKKTKLKIDDIFVNFLKETKWLFLIVISLFTSSIFLSLPGAIETIIRYAFIIVITIEIIKLIQAFIDFAAKKYSLRESAEYKDAVKTMAKIAKFGVWILAILLILQNLGINVSSLIAGLGIGGIAIALAAQNVLGDIFASFSIFFDKPFKTGDFIMVGTEKGEVKKIGIKTTRLQTLNGEELIVSNKELTSAQVHNITRLKKRRGIIQIGVIYETPLKKLKEIPKMIKEELKKIKSIQLDRVHFSSFGDFSLNFEIVFYVNSKEYKYFMDAKQEVNIAIAERFAKEKIEFAYPTQKLFVDKES